MAVELNHTIVACTDKVRSATFLAEMLGLPEPTPFGHFLIVEAANGVSLDFDHRDEVVPQHYAFLVTEEEFDAVYGRIRDRAVRHWADPGRARPDAINHNDGGRGVYFEDPDGHLLEAFTVPYGGWR